MVEERRPRHTGPPDAHPPWSDGHGRPRLRWQWAPPSPLKRLGHRRSVARGTHSVHRQQVYVMLRRMLASLLGDMCTTHQHVPPQKGSCSTWVLRCLVQPLVEAFLAVGLPDMALANLEQPQASMYQPSRWKHGQSLSWPNKPSCRCSHI